jgi:hypothetical protein
MRGIVVWTDYFHEQKFKFLVISDNIMAKALRGFTFANETEEGCLDALVEETARFLGD